MSNVNSFDYESLANEVRILAKQSEKNNKTYILLHVLKRENIIKDPFDD